MSLTDLTGTDHQTKKGWMDGWMDSVCVKGEDQKNVWHENLVKFSHLIYLFRPRCKKDGLNEQHYAPKFAHFINIYYAKMPYVWVCLFNSYPP